MSLVYGITSLRFRGQMIDFILFISISVFIWMKKKYHWKYYVAANGLPDHLDLGEETRNNVYKQNSLSPVLDEIGKFWLPFMGREVLDAGEPELNALRKKAMVCIFGFWLSFTVLAVRLVIQMSESGVF